MNNPPAEPARAFDRRLNLGCGSRSRAGWTNVDVVAGPDVLAHDLRDPLPFPDGAFDLVYHSHVLEHFRPADVPAFLSECRRVLRPGGLLRVVVPDLEGIARGYLDALDRVDAAGAGRDAAARQDREWMTIELYDQAVRETSGGRMGALLRSPGLPNEAFVRERLGEQAAQVLRTRGHREEPPACRPRLRRAAGGLRRGLRAAVRPGRARRALAERLLPGRDREALRVGRFRLSGEVHHWMYDRASLQSVLEEAGFRQVVRRSAADSTWDGWSSQNLDTQPDGTLYKPDSLYMEGVGPA